MAPNNELTKKKDAAFTKLFAVLPCTVVTEIKKVRKMMPKVVEIVNKYCAQCENELTRSAIMAHLENILEYHNEQYGNVTELLQEIRSIQQIMQQSLVSGFHALNAARRHFLNAQTQNHKAMQVTQNVLQELGELSDNEILKMSQLICLNRTEIIGKINEDFPNADKRLTKFNGVSTLCHIYMALVRHAEGGPALCIEFYNDCSPGEDVAALKEMGQQMIDMGKRVLKGTKGNGKSDDGVWNNVHHDTINQHILPMWTEPIVGAMSIIVAAAKRPYILWWYVEPVSRTPEMIHVGHLKSATEDNCSILRHPDTVVRKYAIIDIVKAGGIVILSKDQFIRARVIIDMEREKAISDASHTNADEDQTLDGPDVPPGFWGPMDPEQDPYHGLDGVPPGFWNRGHSYPATHDPYMDGEVETMDVTHVRIRIAPTTVTVSGGDSRALVVSNVTMPRELQAQVEGLPQNAWGRSSIGLRSHCECIHFGIVGPRFVPQQVPKGSSRFPTLEQNLIDFGKSVCAIPFTSMLLLRYNAGDRMDMHTDSNLEGYPWQVVCHWGQWTGGALNVLDTNGVLSSDGPGVFLLNAHTPHEVSTIVDGVRYAFITYAKNLSSTTPANVIERLRSAGYPLPVIEFTSASTGSGHR